jgi:hypothetical protein
LAEEREKDVAEFRPLTLYNYMLQTKTLPPQDRGERVGIL